MIVCCPADDGSALVLRHVSSDDQVD